jgi:WD40 repeat protein/predicted chitinase
MAVLSVLLIAMFGVTVFALALRSRVANALKEVEVERDNAKRAEGRAYEQQLRAESALQSVQQERDKAQIAEGTAAKERDTATRERNRAEEQTKIAQKAKSEADHQKGIAETNYQTAKTERDNALTAKAEAVKASKEAEEQRNKAVELLSTVKEIDSSAPYFKAVIRGHKTGVFSAGFMKNGSQVLSHSRVSDPRQLMNSFVWDSSNDQSSPFSLSEVLPPNTSLLFLSPGGKLAVIGGEADGGSFAAIWNVETKKQLAKFPLDKDAESLIATLISPDDRRVININLEKTPEQVVVIDATTATQQCVLDMKGTSDSEPGGFSPDSNRFVVLRGASAELFDTTTGRIAVRLLGHVAPITKLAFSSDSKLVVTASKDGTARVWEANTGVALAILGGHEGEVNSASFSDDGKYIVTTSEKLAYLWEPRSPGNWKEVSDNSPTILQGHTDQVLNAVFSHDGKWVATISEDRTAQLWDAQVLPRPTGGIGVSAVSPIMPVWKRGTSAALASSVAVFRGHIKPLTSVSFSSDSRYLVTGSEDRTARVWDLTSLGAFSIVSANLKAERSSYEGRCPFTIKFKGTISVTGRSGKVIYKFIRSDGTETLPEELVFDGPGSKEVNTTRDVFFRGVNRAGKPLSTDGWVKLKILEPAVMESDEASFTVKCAEPDLIGGASVIFKDLTPAQVLQIVPEANEQQVANYLPYLQRAMEEFGINTPLRQAAFLAEVVYGTAGFRVLEEKGTAEYLEKQYGYRKDLGNFQAGEGARYKGRGAFMLTGRSNYQAFGSLLGVDLVNSPEKAASPELAFRTAALYWQRNGLNEIADKDDITSVSRRIGGTSGLSQIRAFYDRAKTVLHVGGARID